MLRLSLYQVWILVDKRKGLHSLSCNPLLGVSLAISKWRKKQTPATVAETRSWMCGLLGKEGAQIQGRVLGSVETRSVRFQKWQVRGLLAFKSRSLVTGVKLLLIGSQKLGLPLIGWLPEQLFYEALVELLIWRVFDRQVLFLQLKREEKISSNAIPKRTMN